MPGCASVNLFNAITASNGTSFEYYLSSTPANILPLTDSTNITVAGSYQIRALSAAGCPLDKPTTVTLYGDPTITLGTMPSICEGSVSAILPYTATSGNPTSYTINYEDDALAAGFFGFDGGYEQLPTNPDQIQLDLSYIFPAPPPATYHGTVIVKSVNGSFDTECLSTEYPFTITINGNPYFNTYIFAPACSGVPTGIVLPDHSDNGNIPLTKYKITDATPGGSGQLNQTIGTFDLPDAIHAIENDVLTYGTTTGNIVSYSILPFGQGGCEGYPSQVQVTVKPVPDAPIAVNNTTATYTGALQTASATATGSDVVWYATSDGTVPTNTPPSGIYPGTYTAWAEASNSNGCVSATRTLVTLTIGKAPLQVTAVAPNITYGDDPPAVTVTYGAFVNGESEAVLYNTGFVLGTDYIQGTPTLDGSPVGTNNTTIAMGTASDDNYEFILTPSTFEVGKANLAVTAVAEDIPYGSSGPSITPAFSGLITPDDEGDLNDIGFEFTTDYVQGMPAGLYHAYIAIGTADDNNYKFDPLYDGGSYVGAVELTGLRLITKVSHTTELFTQLLKTRLPYPSPGLLMVMI